MPRLAKGARAAAPPGALLLLLVLLVLLLPLVLLVLLLLLVLLPLLVVVEPRPPPWPPLERGWEGREAPPPPPRGGGGAPVCVGDTRRLSPEGGWQPPYRGLGKEGRVKAAPPSAEWGPGALPARHFLTGLSPLRPTRGRGAGEGHGVGGLGGSGLCAPCLRGG